MSKSKAAPISDGQLATAIAAMVVHWLRVYVGRGPTYSRTYFNEDLICVVLRGTLTASERRLVDGGDAELVLGTRKAFQRLMRADLVAGLEALTGRTVVAFLTATCVDTDSAVASFLLAPEGEADAPAS